MWSLPTTMVMLRGLSSVVDNKPSAWGMRIIPGAIQLTGATMSDINLRDMSVSTLISIIEDLQHRVDNLTTDLAYARTDTPAARGDNQREPDIGVVANGQWEREVADFVATPYKYAVCLAREWARNGNKIHGIRLLREHPGHAYDNSLAEVKRVVEG